MRYGVENTPCRLPLDADSARFGRRNGAEDLEARYRSKLGHAPSHRSVPGLAIRPPWSDKRARRSDDLRLWTGDKLRFSGPLDSSPSKYGHSCEVC